MYSMSSSGCLLHMVSSLIVIPFRQQCCGKSCFCEGVLRTLERNSSCHWRIRSRPGVICCTVDFTVVHTSCIPDATDNNSKSVGDTFPLAAPQTSFLSSVSSAPVKRLKMSRPALSETLAPSNHSFSANTVMQCVIFRMQQVLAWLNSNNNNNNNKSFHF